MITCLLKGGLGNQLFQICTTIAYSFRTKNPFLFSYRETVRGETPRPTYWTTLLKCLYKYTNVDGLIPNNVLESFPIYKGDHGYTEIRQRIDNGNSLNICFDGFFQSYKYFHDEYSRIYELLDIDGFKSQIHFPESLPTIPTISLHFRVGDYAKIRCYHPVLPILYYERALRHIQQTISSRQPNDDSPQFRVYVFFEKTDIEYVKNAIQQLQQVFPYMVFELVEESSDWKQMILMSKCDHHIIANSTFSWWGATFSTPHILTDAPSSVSSSSKIVCYPSIWYGHQLYYINTLDLFPNGWTKIVFRESEMDKSYCKCFSKHS